MVRLVIVWALFLLNGLCVVPRIAFGGPSEARQFRELVNRPLILSCGDDSFSDRFQFEVRCRVVKNADEITEIRIIAERDGNKAAVLVLSPSGYPCSYLNSRGAMLPTEGSVSVFLGGRFDCYAGVIPTGDHGIDLRFTGATAEQSKIIFDFNPLARRAMVSDAEYGWDRRFRELWLATPRGARLSVYLSKGAGPADFPIRAITLHAKRRSDDGYSEMSVTNFHVGVEPPNSILDVRDSIAPDPLGVPYVAATFNEVDALGFYQLGAAFDESNDKACKAALSLAHRVHSEREAIVSSGVAASLRALIDDLSGTDESRVRNALRSLREEWKKHVSDRLRERAAADEDRFRIGFHRYVLDYDRFQMAAATEVALGPDLTSAMHARLADLVTNRELAVSIRCAALDLFGQIGLPAQSQTLSKIEASFATESNEQLQAVLASVRVRQSIASGSDIANLQRAVGRHSQQPHAWMAAIESLAIVDELDSSRIDIQQLIETDEASSPMRGLRALAAIESGQSALLELLEQGKGRLRRRDGLIALGEAMATNNNQWPRLAEIAKSIATNTEFPLSDRVAANRIVHQDGDTLASDYTALYYSQALEANAPNLLQGAMSNMVAAGKGTVCFDAIHAMLARAPVEERLQAAILLVGISAQQWKGNGILPPSFWQSLDNLFNDSDAAVRHYGPISILTLLDLRAPVPQKYIASLVEAGLRAESSQSLSLACVALMRLTNSDYRPPLDRAVSPSEIPDWMEDHVDQVRQHLRDWHQSRQVRHGAGSK